MSLFCYDFSKLTMITMASIAISLTVGLLMQYAHGQSVPYDPLLVEPCTLFKSEHLVILDFIKERCEYPNNAVTYYSSQGFEIKAFHG